MRTVGKGNLYCFSPPVMLATIIIEVLLLAYTLWRYKLDRVTRLVAAMLGLLAIFQLAEYMVCGGLGVTGDMWARLGYGAITLLPPVGIHLSYTLAGRSNWPVIGASYALAAGFAGYFLFATNVFAGSQCTGNYVVFQLGAFSSELYTLYYYGLLLLGVGLSLRFAHTVASQKVKRTLMTFTLGYVLFMLPTTIMNTIDSATIAGIPSIMCGFAVMLALVVVFWVLPQAAAVRGAVPSGRRRQLRRR